MNIFNFFKKNPKVIFWNSVPGLEEVNPPVPAIECIPEWFKKMPQDITEYFSGHPGTLKRCPGFVDFYKEGYVLKLWCDLYVKINEDRTYEVQSPEKNFKFIVHLDNQFLDHIPDRNTFSAVLKGHNPWRIKTPKGWSVMQLPMFYDFNKTFTVLPGSIWTDIHHEINPQIAFYSTGEFFIPRGTPLAVYIPYKRQKIKYEISALTEKLKKLEDVAYFWFASKFRGGYKDHQNKIKRDKS